MNTPATAATPHDPVATYHLPLPRAIPFGRYNHANIKFANSPLTVQQREQLIEDWLRDNKPFHAPTVATAPTQADVAPDARLADRHLRQRAEWDRGLKHGNHLKDWYVG